MNVVVTQATGAGAGGAAAGGMLRASRAEADRSTLSMYSDQPNEMLTLEDFEVLAFERLKRGWQTVQLLIASFGCSAGEVTSSVPSPSRSLQC